MEIRQMILEDRRGPAFVAPAAPSEVKVLQTCVSPIAPAQDHVNFHSVTIHDKLAKIVVLCAAYFMTQRQNLHYKISSQQRLNTEDD